jgi:hypothetical protein
MWRPPIILCAWLIGAGAAPGQKLSFAETEAVYHGSPIRPRVMVDGVPQQAAWSSREIRPDEAPAVFSNRILDPLPLSYSSLGFAANSTSALGNLIELAGDERVADHAEVIMVTWAKAADYPALAAADASGYRHPISASIYELRTALDGTVTVHLVDEATAHVHIPWRPLTLPDGSPYPYNGYAFKALIPLNAAMTLPEQCIVAIAFDTQNHGTNPLKVSGPYNQLNLALTGALPVIGRDPDTDAVFWVQNGKWYYPARNWGGFGSPILRLSARATPRPAPLLDATAEPVNAGVYQVRAEIPGTNLKADTVLSIAQAPVSFETAGLTRSIADPDPFITVVNASPGLEAAIRYDGSASVPVRPGRYPFTITATDRNHSGFLAGEFRLTGMTFQQWQQRQPGDPGGGGGPPAWIAYATGTESPAAEQPLRLQATASGPTASFRRRREMPGVRLELEFSTYLSHWVTPATVVEPLDDLWETVTAAGGGTAGSAGYFRLRARPD